MSIQGIKAQENQIYLTNVHHHAGVSLIRLNDPYLSLLSYSGVGFRYDNLYSTFVRKDVQNLSTFSKLKFETGLTVNPKSTASVTFMGGDFGWGMKYHYRKIKNLTLLGGGLLQGDFRYKSNSRNVNNPINIDASVGLNALLEGRYQLKTSKRIIILNATYEFPVVGCMFVPAPGLSYYEMYLRENIRESIHFSSFHNKTGFKQQYTIDIPFKYSTWMFGVTSESLTYEAFNQVSGFSEFSLLIGITYDFKRFAGRKTNLPDYYISPKY
jgi:hypothetical protein